MEAIFILSQCNFFIGVISSAVIAIGNVQQRVQEEYEDNLSPDQPILIECAEAEYKEPEKKSKTAEKKTEAEAEAEVITSDEVSEEIPDTETENEPEEYYEPETVSVFSEGFDSSFKAYMDYRCITVVGSAQYEMQQQAYTDSRGFRRIGDDYCVALGTGITYGCGERFQIYLDSGYSFSAVVSDVKSDAHTDSTNCYVPRGGNSGNVVEFIIDTDFAEGAMLSSGSAGYYEDLSGNITAIVPI